MFKLLSASVLALGVVCAAPAAAQTVVQGGHLYIQDFDAPVQITYLTSNAAHTTTLYIGVLDADGKFIGSFEPLLKSVGTTGDTASLGSCRSCMMTGGSNTYTFDLPVGGVELVFYWANETANTAYYSGVYTAKSNPSDITGNKWDRTTYYANNTAVVGFEDGGGGGAGGRITDWDWNDVVISVTNVASTPPVVVPPPAIPEPETWAMMLAGLGMVASVARRRRSRIQ